MNNLGLLRDIVVQKLQSETIFKGMVTAEINGNYFSAVDLALPDADGKCKIYRIAVINVL